MVNIRNVLGLATALILVLVVVPPVNANDWTFDDVERVVAISDIHGAYGAMVLSLIHI